MWKFSLQGRHSNYKLLLSLVPLTVISLFTSFAAPPLVQAQKRRGSTQPATQVTVSSPTGRHFIILIDDSGSIAGYADRSGDKRPAIRADLPEKLFGDGKGELDFNPAQDRISVLFFTIRQSGCGTRQPRSVLKENIFELAYTGKLSSKADFSDKLVSWLEGPCRFNGNWSPIVISSLLALPYLQDKLPAGELHTRTILMQVTDGLFTSRTTPGHELTDYRHAGLIENDIETTDKLLNRTARLFSLNIFPSQKPQNKVFYLTAEYLPQRVPESAIQYQHDSLLYPQAYSAGALRYRLNDQLTGDIQLLAQGANAEFNFMPLWLRVAFQNDQGQPWSVGGQTLPREPVRLELTGCDLPQCRQESDRLGVGLFEAGLGGPQDISRYSAAPEPGLIRFRVGFHYDTDLYKHLCAETPELEIKASPAPPAEIPNFYLLPSSTISKADLTAEWVPDGDGVTTQEEAKNRILTRRNLKALLVLIMVILLTILLVIVAFLRYYQRHFAPALNWHPAPEPVIDLNRPGESRLLVGTLKVVNDQPIPWLGRWLRNKEQPTRPANLALSYGAFEVSARARAPHNGQISKAELPRFTTGTLEVSKGNPIGFVQAAETRLTGVAATGLTLFAEEAVADGKQIYVFLAGELITDCQSPLVPEDGLRFEFGFQSELSWLPASKAPDERGNRLARWANWLHARVVADQPGQHTLSVHAALRVKPEVPRKPLVTFAPSSVDPLHFKKDAWIEIGQFLFASQAEHSFAQAYEWGEYIIQTYLDQRPLGGEPIRLGQAHVTIQPFETVSVPVYLKCDGQTVPNPDPAFCTYEFKLVGDFHLDSLPGPYQIKLHRDPTRAEIELKLRHQLQETELYWTPRGELKLQARAGEPVVALRRRDNETIVLPPQTIKFSPRNALPRALFSLEVGNSGTAGRGVVAMDISTHLLTPPASLELESGRSLEDLLGVYVEATQTRKPRVVVPESVKTPGHNPQVREIRFHPGWIEKIPTARISADHLSVEVKLAILIRTDQGETAERKLTLLLPLTLEQAPGLNWLAIDFGTSAIAAALGTGRQDGALLVPLQQIKAANERSFAEFDTDNLEHGDPHLLPSLVVCDSELRKPSGNRQRPGFSGYYSEKLSFTPGEPDFLSLPAVFHDFEENAERIIYSLKSWLGKASGGIRLGRKVRFKEQNKFVERDILPLEEMVESGFAALAEAYLLLQDQSYRADQVVLAHPNTFTRHHQELLHNIAYRALGERFGIPLAERLRLISESDAVAYYYCKQQMNQGTKRAGTERLLIYDFGAGTLDLSLIKVEWKGGPGSFPIRWQVEKRLGVPVAGNYLDELLARLIHELLSDSSVTESGKYEYQFPVVGQQFKAKRVEHSRAILHLWLGIREAKHTWSDACRDILAQDGDWAECPAMQVLVSTSTQTDVVRYDGGEVAREAPEDRPGLWGEHGYFRLSIPAKRIQQDERLKQFREFVTREVIDELLGAAGCSKSDVNTVIVSGRGALFAGLRDLVWSCFPDAQHPDLLADQAMKVAVVQGAIARQELAVQLNDASAAAELSPRLAVLLQDEQQLVFEEDWDKPIDLSASPTFRVVQVSLQKPNPREDMRSLRQHFYIDVAEPYYRRDDVLGDGKQLYVRKRQHEDRLAIYLEGQGSTIAITELQLSRTVTTPPWPVGPKVLLDPQG